MRKTILEKKLQRLLDKQNKLAARAQASTEVAEVRSINDQLESINDEIMDIQDEIEAIEEEERQAELELESRSVPVNARPQNTQILGAFGQQTNATQKRENTDPYATMEYRMAFKRFVQTGEKIPANLIQRDNMAANTSQLGATIPTTVLNEFINEVRLVYGQLYDKVRKLNIKGGVKVPIAELQATFKWVTETTVAPREDGGKIDEYVEFSYNMAEIRISQTLLSSIVTLDIFEREIVKVMVIAYKRAMDLAIMKGTGNGQPLGILNDPRITNVVEMTEADFDNWVQWKKKFFAKLPLGYRAGEFVFPLATIDAHLETMRDNNNNPIYREAAGLEVNDGDATNPNGRFFGRAVSIVEPDVITDFDTASAGDVVGVFWQPEEYAINTQAQFGMKRWLDEDRNEWVNKMLTIVDGKVLNPKGIWIIKKKGN